MEKSTMNQNKFQTYFESLCNSFYITYQEIKRIEKEEEELKNASPHDELETIECLLNIPVENKYWNNYVEEKCSREEVQQRREKLKKDLKEHKEKSRILSKEKEDWYQAYSDMSEALFNLIYTIKNNKLTIVVTSEEEIIALMNFFIEKRVEQYRVINVEEENLKQFPTSKEMYQEFYKAYCLKDDELMKEVCRKYY